MPQLHEHEAEILLVEDNPGDVRLTQEALRAGKMLNQLNVVSDGEQAMAYVRRQPPYQDATRPQLILLDLNLPKKDGREVLAELKNDPDLRAIPVVILTSSDAESDVARTYNLHANCYIRKPVDFDQFVSVIQQIDVFWMRFVTLPE